MAWWVFGPADYGVSLAVQYSVPRIHPKPWNGAHTLCRRRRFVPEYNHGGWHVLQRRFILWFKRPSGYRICWTFPATACPVILCQ